MLLIIINIVIYFLITIINIIIYCIFVSALIPTVSSCVDLWYISFIHIGSTCVIRVSVVCNLLAPAVYNSAQRRLFINRKTDQRWAQNNTCINCTHILREYIRAGINYTTDQKTLYIRYQSSGELNNWLKNKLHDWYIIYLFIIICNIFMFVYTNNLDDPYKI